MKTAVIYARVSSCGAMADRQSTERQVTSCKTYQVFLPIENKELTKIVSLTGNDLVTTIRSERNPLSFN